VPILFLIIVILQVFYDAEKLEGPKYNFPLSLYLVQGLDLGLHSAAAAFFWIDTRTEIPFLKDGYDKFSRDLKLINDLDPKFSTPYIYTSIVLPNSKYENAIAEAIKIGERGVKESEPNWQVPFYLAVNYHLYLKDTENAVKNFDKASLIPGIPEIVRRFAINYGIFPNRREQTKKIWEVVYQTSEDESVRTRAKAYVIHYDIVDVLQKAVDAYKGKLGYYPETIDDLVKSNYVKAIPEDPFGFEFDLYKDGDSILVGIKQPDRK